MRIFRSRYKINEAGTISHITQRAPGREILFAERADYLYMLYLMKDLTKKFSLEIFAFVLMPNHVHLLIRQTKENLYDAMKDLFSRYAMYFNNKYERKGHVFCGTFRQAICLDESYLFTITVYIHINPVRAGLAKDPLEYPWSSCRPYVKSIGAETFLKYKDVLNMLDTEIERARCAYKGILNNACTIKTVSYIEQPKIIKKFRMDLSKIMWNSFNKEYRENKIFDYEIENRIESAKGKKRLKKPADIAARKYLIQQLLSRGYNITEIADKMEISRQSVYSNLTKPVPREV